MFLVVATGAFAQTTTPYDKVLSLNLNKVSNKTYTHKWFYSRTNAPCVNLTNCINITFIDCLFGQADSLGIKNMGLYAFGCQNITVTNSYVENVSTGFLIANTVTARIDNCQGKNMQGPFPRGAFVQFNNVTGAGSSVSYNKLENFDNKSNPEDCINMYKSSGTPESPIMITYNMIRCNQPKSKTGGGILAGDNGGSYITIRYNKLVSPGNYAFGIASGNNIDVEYNAVFSPKHANSLISNVALSIHNWHPEIMGCSINTVAYNSIKWYSDKYSIAKFNAGINNLWNDGTCTNTVGLTSNDYNAKIDASLLPTQLLTFTPFK